MELLATACPCCQSRDVMRHTLYTTQNQGERTIYRCKSCEEYFSETTNTFLAGIRKPISTIIHVIKARTEGMGLNAVCRTFELSKNTVLRWEERFTRIKQTLLLYALLHQFFQLQIEGDEVYTRVERNTPPTSRLGGL